MEGEISLEELKTAWRNSKKGKTPGCGGLSTEFYVYTCRCSFHFDPVIRIKPKEA